MAAKIDLNGVGSFDPHGDPSHVGETWKRWLRSFELFATGKGVGDPAQKKALLLHCAGLDVQDVYFTLPAIAGDDDVFAKTVTALNKHFEPKSNIPYERYCFRLMKQEENETVDQFVTRLRRQTVLCKFDKPDEQIRDQVIEKCRSHKIRTKLLERGQDLTLDQLRTISMTTEMADRQAKAMQSSLGGPSNSVNMVSSQSGTLPKWEKSYVQSGTKSKTENYSKESQKRKCYRCDREGHFAKDPQCPAKNKKCTKCGLLGHFAVCCKTKEKGGRHNDKKSYKRKPGFVSQVDEDSDDEYTFIVGSEDKTERIKVLIGGNPVNMIIDSGATVNIIDSSLWEELKANKIKCQSEKTSKRLFAYGSDQPLQLKGVFSTQVSLADDKNGIQEKFYVLKGKGPALLGKTTATQLGVLKTGVVHSIESDIFEQYPDLFQGIGKLKDYKLKLHLDKNVRPVAQHMYRVPYSLRQKVSDKLDELESEGIIEKVNNPTPWVSPVIVVPKPDNDIRLCVDMRQANKAILRERHPIPTVDEILYNLNGSEVFSKLDLKYGFHQIELEESSREITTFVTHKGLYRYRRLMFGINAAPEKYQQVISQVFHDCDGVQNISDDIVVHGCDQQDHDEKLRKALDRLREKNLTLNKGKCQIGIDRITFMGHVMSKHGVEPTEGRVKAIVNAEKPTSSSEVRSFLGLVNFSGRYIPDLASISEPLRRLTKKSETFRWGPEQEKSFQELKNCLTRAETLGYFRLDAERTMLVTDASNVGLGGVLIQEYQGETKVINYASRTLSDVERRYSTTEKEGLAVVWACEKFHLYLYGIDFELVTDHKPLEALYGPKARPSARIERWMLKLMPYTYKIRYAPGKTNIADALSRLVKLNQTENCRLETQTESYINFVAREATPTALTAAEVDQVSQSDAELSEVRKCLRNAQWDKSCVQYYPIRDELCILGNLVLRGTRLVIPEKLRFQCIELAHRGHLGIVGTKQQLRTKVWWPNMDKDVEKFVKSCHGCQIVSAMPHPEPLEPTPIPTGPWQDLAIDLLGPLESGHYVFVVVDYYSRYYEIEITKDTTSERMIEAMENMFSRHGLPVSVTSDNGPQFVSGVFETYLSNNGIRHRRVTPLHPAANGEVERQNRSLMKRIRIAHAESRDWKTEIRAYLLAYRTTPHSTTGVSPAELMFGRKLRTKLPQVEQLTGEVKDLRNEGVRDHDTVKKFKNKLYLDNKRGAEESNLQQGDTVLVKNVTRNKMDTPFIKSPFRLIAKQGNSCVVESPEGVHYRRNSTHVKRYVEPVSETNIRDDHQESEVASSSNNQQVSEPVTDTTVGDDFRNMTITTPQRPIRERKPPKRFEDYVT